MKTRHLALAFILATSTAAVAQQDMSCADYLKGDQQMQAALTPADRAALASDPAATALDRKVRDYCTKNPRAPASEAMAKAMQ